MFNTIFTYSIHRYRYANSLFTSLSVTFVQSVKTTCLVLFVLLLYCRCLEVLKIGTLYPDVKIIVINFRDIGRYFFFDSDYCLYKSRMWMVATIFTIKES